MPITVSADPYPFSFELGSTALVLIDFQRDFLEPGGFGALLGNDVANLTRAVAPTVALLANWRARGLPVIHTREGHRPDLSDCPPAKRSRGNLSVGIGDTGPMGRVLVHGEPGWSIIPELTPLPHEAVIDKPGKGAFYATELQEILQTQQITSLIVTGVTTEVCVHTTVREANDRGYECLVLEDCVGSYFPDFQRAALQMIAAQGGIFGWVSDSNRLMEAMQ